MHPYTKILSLFCEQAVEMIRQSGEAVTFLLVDEEDKKFMKAKGFIIKAGVMVAGELESAVKLVTYNVKSVC